MAHSVYIRLKKKKIVTKKKEIRLIDIASISTLSPQKEKMKQTLLYTIKRDEKDFIVIDAFYITKTIEQLFSVEDIQFIGPTETTIYFQSDRGNVHSIILFCFVWLILFVGTAMTIINFHYDVSMQEVHEKLHYILSGKLNPRPLMLQIPYSIGLGIGMIIFLNRILHKQINKEPSPLEVEVFKYERDIQDYITHTNNEFHIDKEDKNRFSN